MFLKALSSYFNFISGLIDFIKSFMFLHYYANSKCFTGLEHRLVSNGKYSEMGQQPETLCFMNIQHLSVWVFLYHPFKL